MIGPHTPLAAPFPTPHPKFTPKQLIASANYHQSVADDWLRRDWDAGSAKLAQEHYAHRNWAIARLYDAGIPMPNPYVSTAAETRAAMAKLTAELGVTT